EKEAVIRVSTTLDNALDIAPISVVHELMDHNGERVAVTVSKETAAGHARTTLTQEMTLAAPQLWDIDSPYLYTLKTLVY
ncbi:MAG TPA: hypothetical protein PLG66_19760, partial [Calditrichia bacterium]|nr:hypothetical protein [Calditrichia bacterium]